MIINYAILLFGLCVHSDPQIGGGQKGPNPFETNSSFLKNLKNVNEKSGKPLRLHFVAYRKVYYRVQGLLYFTKSFSLLKKKIFVSFNDFNFARY